MKTSNEADEFTLARKVAKWIEAPVPQTDTGRRGENPKTGERIIVKELCKMTPELRDKGCLREQVTEKRPKQLFTKNTGLCEIER